MTMKEILQQLARGVPLTAEQAESAFTEMMEGTALAEHTASLLTFLAMREPTVEELAGAATVMRRHAVAIDAPENVIDTCGTGGVGSDFFNVSTAAAIVAAAAGATVAKHGNRSVTSKSGSSDVLRALGVNIDTTPEQEAACLREAGICFAFAPRHHPAMKYVQPIRQSLGFSTVFNILGPLTNPAGARRQLVGTRSAGLADKLLEVLVRLGAVRAMVVSGVDISAGPVCEISITGPTHVAQFDAGEGGAKHYSLSPADFGFRYEASEELSVRSPEESAAKIKAILAGTSGAPRDIVVINAAAALWVGSAAASMSEGLVKAAAAIDSGRAARTLETLVACSRAAV